MNDTVPRIVGRLLGLLFPATGRHRAPDACRCPGAADALASRLANTGCDVTAVGSR